MDNRNNRVYFASANTTQSFRCYFDRIFDPNKLEKIFIVKGGPGTGKSSLMRQIALLAEDSGFSVERFLCSSDPDSLDGILITDLKFAMIDGTAPHNVDPIYPGIVENIINTVSYCNIADLVCQKSRIISLNREKKRCYGKAYRFLNAAGEIESEILMGTKDSFLTEKADRFLERLCKKVFIPRNKGFESIRLTESFNRYGLTVLNSFAEDSKTVYLLQDFHYSAYLLLDSLYQKAKTAGQSFLFSCSCLFPDHVSSLYFPEQSIAFVVENDKKYREQWERNGKTVIPVNLKRFVSENYPRDHKQKLRFARRCAEMLREGAAESFSDASRAHGELERIYIASMDFQALNRKIPDLWQSIQRKTF